MEMYNKILRNINYSIFKVLEVIADNLTVLSDYLYKLGWDFLWRSLRK